LLSANAFGMNANAINDRVPSVAIIFVSFYYSTQFWFAILKAFRSTAYPV